MKFQALRRHPWRTAFAVTAVAALSWWGGQSLFSKPPAPSYLTAPVARENLERTVLASGRLQAFKQVDVGTQATGQLKEVRVKAGDQVKKGQLLAEIDPAEMQNQLKAAQASLDQQQAQRASTQAALELARLEQQRQRAMMVDQSTSQKELQAAEAALKQRQAELASLDAQIRATRFELERKQVQLGYTRIIAPMDGTVLSIETPEGQTVVAAQNAVTILKLADLSTMTVRALISEADVIRVRTGQKAYFTLLGDGEQRVWGKLRTVEPKPEKINEAMFYSALFDVPNAGQRLRVDMTAQVGVVLDEARGVLAVPVTALGAQGKDGRYAVRVLGADGKVDTRQVRVGLRTSTRAQVLDGLKQGEKVITRDGARLDASDSVSVVF